MPIMANPPHGSARSAAREKPVAEVHRVDLGDGRTVVVAVHCEELDGDQEAFQLEPRRRAATYHETITALQSLMPQ